MLTCIEQILVACHCLEVAEPGRDGGDDTAADRYMLCSIQNPRPVLVVVLWRGLATGYDQKLHGNNDLESGPRAFEAGMHG